jgi:hypothetical protein
MHAAYWVARRRVPDMLAASTAAEVESGLFEEEGGEETSVRSLVGFRRGLAKLGVYALAYGWVEG